MITAEQNIHSHSITACNIYDLCDSADKKSILSFQVTGYIRIKLTSKLAKHVSYVFDKPSLVINNYPSLNFMQRFKNFNSRFKFSHILSFNYILYKHRKKYKNGKQITIIRYTMAIKIIICNSDNNISLSFLIKYTLWNI